MLRRRAGWSACRRQRAAILRATSPPGSCFFRRHYQPLTITPMPAPSDSLTSCSSISCYTPLPPDFQREAARGDWPRAGGDGRRGRRWLAAARAPFRRRFRLFLRHMLITPRHLHTRRAKSTPGQARAEKFLLPTGGDIDDAATNLPPSIGTGLFQPVGKNAAAPVSTAADIMSGFRLPCR